MCLVCLDIGGDDIVSTGFGFLPFLFVGDTVDYYIYIYQHKNKLEAKWQRKKTAS